MRQLILCMFVALPIVGQSLAPRVALDADGAVAMTLYRGRPLFVNGLLTHSQRAEATPAIVLSPKDAGWMDALKITTYGTDGQEQSWPLMPLGAAESKTITLPPKGIVRLSWMLPSSATAELATGTYVLILALSISESPGWNGAVSSGLVTVQVEDEPADISADDRRRLGLLRAREAQVTGATEEKVILARLFKEWPQDVGVLTAMALSMDRDGAPAGLSLVFVQAAVEVFLKSGSVHAPVGLMELRNRLEAQEAAATPDVVKK